MTDQPILIVKTYTSPNEAGLSSMLLEDDHELYRGVKQVVTIGMKRFTSSRSVGRWVAVPVEQLPDLINALIYIMKTSL